MHYYKLESVENLIDEKRELMKRINLILFRELLIQIKKDRDSAKEKIKVD